MTRPDFGKGSVSRRVVCVGLPVLALLAAGGARAQPKGESLGHSNDRVMPIPDELWSRLSFVPGTAELSDSSLPAIAGIHQLWLQAVAPRYLVSMAVRADVSLAGVEAVRQEKRRAAVLGRALVRSGIRSNKVIVWPLSSKPKEMNLSCPPVG